MTATIHYETPDGIDTVMRDEWHAKEGMIAAYDNPESSGVKNKVAFPKERVVRIDG